MAGGKVFTEREKAKVLRLYKEGVHTSLIATALGNRSENAIKSLLTRLRSTEEFGPITMRTTGSMVKWTPEIVKEWRQLLRLIDDRGYPLWTYKKIAEKYGTSPNTVSIKLQEYNL